MIEFYAEPAVVLSISPRVKNRDAGNSQLVAFDLRQLVDSNRLEPGFRYGSFQLLSQGSRIIRGLDDERSGIELLATGLKRLLRGGNLHVP